MYFQKAQKVMCVAEINFLEASVVRVHTWMDIMQMSQMPVEELFEYGPNFFPINCPKSQVS